MNIAALQLATLPLSNSKLRHYFSMAQEKNVELVLLGEYVLNSFFKELESMPLVMIKEQSNYRIDVLKEYSLQYGLTIIAPVVQVKGEKIYKTILKVSNNSIKFYKQHFLMNYSHWNEEKFFDNEISDRIEPFIFIQNSMKFGIMSGYEMHFDIMWKEMMKKGVSVVLIPSVSTFGSNYRWNEILKTRAFLNGMYILRANRVGRYHDDEGLWNFYGESCLVNPSGYIESSLGSKEGLLVHGIDKKEIKDAKKAWGFKTQLTKRGLL